MRLDRKGIPANVLNGHVPKYISVYNAYRARMCEQIMMRLNRSFWARAKRGADDLGNTWKPLSPKTHAYKPLSPIEKNTYEIANTMTRGLLTPEQDLVWRTIFARIYNRLIKKGISEYTAKKNAGMRAWGVVKARGGRTLIGLNRITDTNIRTGVLVAATRPGSVANNRYYPVKNQRIQINPRSVKISFDIPYAKDVDRQRPIVPDNIEVWVRQAHDIAILEALAIYERIKTATPDRRKSPKRQSTPRRKKQ